MHLNVCLTISTSRHKVANEETYHRRHMRNGPIFPVHTVQVPGSPSIQDLEVDLTCLKKKKKVTMWSEGIPSRS